MMRLAGKRALVTAAGQGIERATAEAFVQEGAHTITTDIDSGLLADFQGSEIRTLDIADAHAIEALYAELGGVDILFNGAGYVATGAIADCSDHDWPRYWAINVTSMYHTIRIFLPAMLDAGGGSIINMASLASSLRGVPERFAYAPTKAAVIGLTKSIAAHIARGGTWHKGKGCDRFGPIGP